MLAPARRAAWDVLRAVHTGRADLPAALAVARARLADDRDRGLAAEIATGTLRWRAALDHAISQASGRGLESIDPQVLDVLRLSAYQLFHLSRVPASAAVDDAVTLTRAIRRASAAGFVNAVLRRLSRTRASIAFPVRPERVTSDADRAAAIDYLSITLSHPAWLVTRWLDREGLANADTWARFNNEAAPLTLRANRLRIDRDALAVALLGVGVTTRPCRYAQDGLEVEGGNPLRTPLAEPGLFVVQDEASQLVALLADAGPGEWILDTCAAPGGKTTALAADMRDQGVLVAADYRPRRLGLLKTAVAASGATAIRLVRLDLRQTLPFTPRFDCVFVDAPCSGLGTIRRDPDIRWRRREDDLSGFADTQVTMLAHAAATVRPGGRLVYATCSSEPEENELVVERFLATRPAFARRAAHRLPASLGRFLDAHGQLHTSPARDGLEAFFGAVLEHRR